MIQSGVAENAERIPRVENTIYDQITFGVIVTHDILIFKGKI